MRGCEQTYNPGHDWSDVESDAKHKVIVRVFVNFRQAILHFEDQID